MRLDSMGECMGEMVKALESEKTAEMVGLNCFIHTMH